MTRYQELTSHIFSSLAMLSVGSIYAFSLYATQLGTLNNLTPVQTSHLVQFANGGLFIMGPIFGLLIDKLKQKSISRFIFHWIGSALLSSMYIILAVFRLQFPVLCICFLFLGFGGSAVYHKSINLNIKNVPGAIAIGIPVAVFGLAALFYSTIASLFFYNDQEILDVESFLLFVGIFCGIINFTVPIFLYPFNQVEQVDLETEFLLLSQTRNYKSCFIELDAYLIATIFFCITGVGLLQINNIGTVISMIDPNSQKIQNTHVKIISLCNFLGRFGTGFFVDYLNRIPKNSWMFLSITISFIGCLFGTWSNLELLYGSSVFIGVGYGIIWTIIPVIIKEFWGIERFSTHWGVVTVLPAFSGLVTGIAVGIGFGMERVDVGYYFGMILCGIAGILAVIVTLRRNRAVQLYEDLDEF